MNKYNVFELGTNRGDYFEVKWKDIATVFGRIRLEKEIKKTDN